MAAIAEAVSIIFMMIVGFGTLYLSFRRDAVVWAIISAVLFGITALVGLSAPFLVNLSEQTMETPINYLLFGTSLIFSFIGVLQSVRLAFRLFTGDSTTT